MIERVVKALSEGDFLGLADCFAEEGRYFDYSPAVVDKKLIIGYGRDGVEMIFRNKFTFKTFSVFDPIVLDEKTADFYGYYEGIYVHSLLTIEELDAEGKIVKLVVRPA